MFFVSPGDEKQLSIINEEVKDVYGRKSIPQLTLKESQIRAELEDLKVNKRKELSGVLRLPVHTVTYLKTLSTIRKPEQAFVEGRNSVIEKNSFKSLMTVMWQMV